MKERVGTNVLLVREPNGLEAYHLSSPFTVSANSDKWVNTSQRLANSAYFAHIDSNYTGNVFIWLTQSNSNIVKMDIESERTERFLSVEILDREPIKFQLPDPVSGYQMLGLRIAYGCTVTAYADCYELTSPDLSDLIHGTNSTRNVTIFKSASASNMPKVRMCMYVCICICHFQFLSGFGDIAPFYFWQNFPFRV